MNEPPLKIWLRWNEDYDESENGPVEEGDVTWNFDKVAYGDVAYTLEECPVIPLWRHLSIVGSLTSERNLALDELKRLRHELSEIKKPS